MTPRASEKEVLSIRRPADAISTGGDQKGFKQARQRGIHHAMKMRRNRGLARAPALMAAKEDHHFLTQSSCAPCLSEGATVETSAATQVCARPRRLAARPLPGASPYLALATRCGAMDTLATSRLIRSLA